MSQAVWWLNKGQFDYITHIIVEDFKVPAQVLGVIQAVGRHYATAWLETNTGDIWTWGPSQKVDGTPTRPTATSTSPFQRYLRTACVGLLLDIRDAETMSDWPGTMTDFRLRKLDRAEIRELARVVREQQSRGPQGLAGEPK